MSEDIGANPAFGPADPSLKSRPIGFNPGEGELPCACGRLEGRTRDHESIREIKRHARVVGPEALAYIEELEALWDYAKRQGNVWRGIAAAMGYEPNAHEKVKPTSEWLLARVAKYSARAASIPLGGA